jgi:GT2 family glycosyltransferase
MVTYRCRDEARACLESVHERTRGVTFEVIVLDNASADGTAEMIRSEFPHVRLVELSQNIGFAAGVNRATDEAQGEYVMMLNPDAVVHEGAVEALVRFAGENPGHGLYGGRTLWPDGTVCPGSCWGLPTLWSLSCFATLLSTIFKNSRLFDPESLGRWKRDSVREVDVVTGCMLVVPQTVWRSLRGFDERFFMYGEDADLAMRAARKGLRPIITPDAVITHKVGVSSSTRSDKLVLLLSGKATFVRKHWPTGRRHVGLALLWAGVGLRAALGKLPGPMATGAQWIPVWRARGEWLHGYPAVRADVEADAASRG